VSNAVWTPFPSRLLFSVIFAFSAIMACLLFFLLIVSAFRGTTDLQSLEWDSHNPTVSQKAKQRWAQTVAFWSAPWTRIPPLVNFFHLLILAFRRVRMLFIRKLYS
jgi:hypothetical protein